MRNFINKIDNDETSAGQVVANEYNSIFNEAKSAVTPFLTLDESDNKQLIKAIDICSKSIFYNDVGAPNALHLTRGATSEQIETLFDGLSVMFSPNNANTGASTLKINALPQKQILFNNSALLSGMLSTGSKYMAVYKQSDDSFHIDILSNGKSPLEQVYGTTYGIATGKDGKNLTGNVGDIIIRPINSIPRDYLECNGSFISRSTFGHLFNVIGTTYGAGDGSTTFSLPDFRGEFMRGWDHGRGVDSDRNIATYQPGTKIGGEDGDSSSANGHTIHDINNIYGDAVHETTFDTRMQFTLSSHYLASGTRWWRTVRPRNMSVMYCIKY